VPDVTVLDVEELAEHLAICPLEKVQCQLCDAKMTRSLLGERLLFYFYVILFCFILFCLSHLYSIAFEFYSDCDFASESHASEGGAAL